MVCCLLCFSSDPVDGDERAYRPNKFQVSLSNGACPLTHSLTYSLAHHYFTAPLLHFPTPSLSLMCVCVCV